MDYTIYKQQPIALEKIPMKKPYNPFFKFSLFLLLAITTQVKAIPTTTNCKHVLSQSSQQWVDDYSEKNNSTTLSMLQAIKLYGNCYDKNLDTIKKKLDASGRGPLMGANAQFNDLQQALEHFTHSALAISAGGGTYDRLSAAFSMLYLKQFRQHFYQAYLKKSKALLNNPQALAKAKTYFSNQLKALSASEKKRLSSEFDKVLQLASATKTIPLILLYHHAIALLQSPVDSPFAPPPF